MGHVTRTANRGRPRGEGACLAEGAAPRELGPWVWSVRLISPGPKGGPSAQRKGSWRGVSGEGEMREGCLPRGDTGDTRGGEGGPGGMGDGERERVTTRHGKEVSVGEGPQEEK